jgi:hypothetical protein
LVWLAGVDLCGSVKGAAEAFEYGFGDVVWFVAVE